VRLSVDERAEVQEIHRVIDVSIPEVMFDGAEVVAQGERSTQEGSLGQKEQAPSRHVGQARPGEAVLLVSHP
jgi:hypothetical protein